MSLLLTRKQINKARHNWRIFNERCGLASLEEHQDAWSDIIAKLHLPQVTSVRVEIIDIDRLGDGRG